MLGNQVIITDGNEMLRGTKGVVVEELQSGYLLINLKPGQGRQVGKIFVPYPLGSRLLVRLDDVTVIK